MFIRELRCHSVSLPLFRAEELETALMEMVKQDNRRQLHARVLNSENYYTLQFFFFSYIVLFDNGSSFV